MSLIYLTREFQNGALQFDLPNLDNGFLKIFVSARVDAYGLHELSLEIGGRGNHVFISDPPQPNSDPVTEGPVIVLGRSDAEGNPSALFQSEILFGLTPGNPLVSMQALTSNLKRLPGAIGDPFLPYQRQVSGGRRATALGSVRISIASPAVSGHARLIWYPHIENLQAEI